MLTVIFLLINGPGKWSLDAVLQRNWRKGGVSEPALSSRPIKSANCGKVLNWSGNPSDKPDRVTGTRRNLPELHCWSCGRSNWRFRVV